MSTPRLRAVTDAMRDAIDRATSQIEAEAIGRPLFRGGDGTGALYVVSVRVSGVQDELHDVEINSTLVDVRACAPGSALLLRRSPSTGRLEVVGFSSRKPGSHRRYAVDVTAGTLGAAQDVGITVRALTYGELATLGGGYGSVPYGAYGVFRGSTLLRIGA